MFITKDPDTGRQNIGNYRAMVKSPTRLGMNPEIELNQGIHEHWLKYKARGERMPAVLLLGAPPAIVFAAVHKLRSSSMNGGRGRARRRADPRVQGQDRQPDRAGRGRIVIEGSIDTEWLEPEGSFGKWQGYMN